MSGQLQKVTFRTMRKADQPDQQQDVDHHNGNHHDEDIMLKGKLHLTLRERLTLELMMLTPIAVVFAVLRTTHSFILTLFGFHVFLVAYPIIFMKKKNVHIDWISLFKQDLQKYARKFKHDINLVAVPTILIVACYVIFRRIFPNYAYESIRIPLVSDSLIAALLVVEFIIINPIVEEVFWRFFCDMFIGRGQTVLQKLDVAFHFALYHWFVVHYIFQDPFLATAGFFGLLNLGFILSIVKQKFGLITAMIIHVGVDLAVGIVILDLQTNLLPLY